MGHNGAKKKKLVKRKRAEGFKGFSDREKGFWIALSAGMFAVVLGLVVIIGWYTEFEALIQISPKFAPMQYNTALGFILGGIGLLALIWEKLTLTKVLGGMVSFLGVVTMSQYIFGFNLGLDNLFMDHYITARTLNVGRMGPGTTIGFLLFGAALVLYSYRKSKKSFDLISEFTGMAVVAIASLAFLSYLVSFNISSPFLDLTLMAPHTTTGFMILGVGFLFNIWGEKREKIATVPLWLPVFLLFSVLSFDFYSPLGIAAGVAYVPLVLCALWFKGRYVPYTFAVLATILTIVGFFAAPDVGAATEQVLINRGLSILAIWITAFAIFVQKRTEGNLVASEKELENRSNYLETITNNMDDALIGIDRRGIILSVNQAAKIMFGYTLEEMVGKNIKMLMRGENHKDHDTYLKNYRETGQAKIVGMGSREVQGFTKKGNRLDLELTVNACTLDERNIYIGIIKDITEKKAAAERLRQAQKMEAVGNLSGGIAHDFNNLLTAIQGSLQLLELVETNFSQKARDCLKIALDASKRGADLTHRLLAFSRKQTLNPSVVEVNQLVRELIPLFNRTIDESITIETHLMDRETFIKVDTSEMENALLNLTVNARDAMPEGGLLTFEVEETEVKKVKAGEREIEPGFYVILSISDNGSGMPLEVRNQVFEPFFTTKGVDKGTGLGLSMVYGFVKQSGGHVTVYSEPGQGTTFKLYLKVSEDQEMSTPRKKKSFDLKAKQSGTILLVEDDEGVCEFVAQALTSKGYTVLDVSDGPSALKVMDEIRKIDLLLTDVVLPKGMSGPDIGEVFEKKFPGCGIIYSSGYTGKAIAINGWLQNGDDLLSKPYDLEVLFERVYDKILNFKTKKGK